MYSVSRLTTLVRHKLLLTSYRALISKDRRRDLISNASPLAAPSYASTTVALSVAHGGIALRVHKRLHKGCINGCINDCTVRFHHSSVALYTTQPFTDTSVLIPTLLYLLLPTFPRKTRR